MFIGWTVKLIEKDVTSEDFDFFNHLGETNPNFEAFEGKYSQYTDDATKVKLVVDGMSGEYVRLIYILLKIEISGILMMKMLMINYLMKKFQKIFIMN